MYYTNSMKVTLKNKKVATAALEIMKARLTAGFDCDKNYRRTPSMRMCEDLEVVKNTIVLPEDCGYYFADDAAKVIPELMKELAAHLSGESFTFGTCNSTDYDEGWVDGSYANGELKVKNTYLPAGFGDFYCPVCGEVIATMNDDADGNIFVEYKEGVCPECGEEIDFSEWLPVISENTINIF